MQKSVNRYFKNQTMDNIDHAIGRPVNPLEESYRNYFEAGSAEEAEKFVATGFWQSKGNMCVVNDAGRRALHEFLMDTQK